MSLKPLLLVVFINAFLFAVEKEKLEDAVNFLELYNNHKKIYELHEQESQINQTLDRTNRINFALKPYKSPIKSFDMLFVHHAYPLKVFLPNNSIITSAELSNSEAQPSFSQNMLKVQVQKNFESGVLDIVYLDSNNLKDGKLISIKLDKYLPDINSNSLKTTPLFTQARYFESEKLSNSEILGELKESEYDKLHTQVQYMGLIYDVYLTSITENGKYIKKYKEDKYSNASILFKNRTYNYQVVQGEIK